MKSAQPYNSAIDSLWATGDGGEREAEPECC